MILVWLASLSCRGPAEVAPQPVGRAPPVPRWGEMPMPAPDTTLDRRYSDPAPVAVPWAETEAAVLTTGCSRWDQGLDVVVEGDAVLVTDDAVLSRAAGAFAVKWDGRWQYTARDGCFGSPDGSFAAMVFSVTPVKVFAHATGAGTCSVWGICAAA
jgi:hypothetical protein